MQDNVLVSTVLHFVFGNAKIVVEESNIDGGTNNKDVIAGIAVVIAVKTESVVVIRRMTVVVNVHVHKTTFLVHL